MFHEAVRLNGPLLGPSWRNLAKRTVIAFAFQIFFSITKKRFTAAESAWIVQFLAANRLFQPAKSIPIADQSTSGKSVMKSRSAPADGGGVGGGVGRVGTGTAGFADTTGFAGAGAGGPGFVVGFGANATGFFTGGVALTPFAAAV